MSALKAAEIDAYLAKPDLGRPIALVFGPDHGLVTERCQAIIRATVDDINDPFGLVRLSGDDLAADHSRLLDEALTVPLFGKRRAIWIRAGSRDFTPAVEPLLQRPISDCCVVIEAGDLRRNAALRTMCERARSVAAIACYADGERDLARLVDSELRASSLTIAPDARAALVALLGADRSASRNEIRKLALYARGKERVELDDVLDVVTDASNLTLESVVDAAFAGRPGEVETQFAKARAAGIPPGRVIGAALGQIGQLHRARLAIEQGTPSDLAVDQITSKAQFRRKPIVEATLRDWTSARLERAMAQIADAALEIRRLSGPTSPLADAVANRVLMSVAAAARRRQ